MNAESCFPRPIRQVGASHCGRPEFVFGERRASLFLRFTAQRDKVVIEKRFVIIFVELTKNELD